MEKTMEAHPVKPCDGLATMTLDEAIEHAEAKSDNTPCGLEHAALAAWLRELRRYRNSNVAKLREAAGNALCCLNWMDESTNDEATKAHLAKPIEILSVALSAPPRNCDVGTDIEQAKRFWRFCDERACDECPLPSIKGGACELFWGQMPYEAPAASDSK